MARNPTSVSVQCIASVPAPDVSVVTDEADNCDATPTVSFVSDANNGGSGCTASPYIVTRTYRVTDDCGNSTDVTQTITAVDDTDPTASNPTSVSVQCIASVPAPDVSVVVGEADNCDATPTVSFVSDANNGGAGCVLDPYIVTRTYRVTDDCGNSTDVSQTITAVDDTDPTASNPTSVSVQCIASVPAPDVSVVVGEADNCDATPRSEERREGNECGARCVVCPFSV